MSQPPTGDGERTTLDPPHDRTRAWKRLAMARGQVRRRRWGTKALEAAREEKSAEDALIALGESVPEVRGS